MGTHTSINNTRQNGEINYSLFMIILNSSVHIDIHLKDVEGSSLREFEELERIRYA